MQQNSPGSDLVLYSGSTEPSSVERHSQLLHHTDPLVVRIFHILIVRRWIVLGVAAAIIALAAMTTAIAPRQFAAEAMLRIGTYSPILRGLTSEQGIAEQTKEYDYLNTQIEILGGLSVADAVLSDKTLSSSIRGYLLGESKDTDLPPSVVLTRDGATAAASYNHSIDELGAYQSLVRIIPVRMTSLVKVVATTTNADLSAMIANTHAESFINYLRSERNKLVGDNSLFLQQQAREIAGKLVEAERKLGDYAEDNALVSLNKDENIVVQRMAELSRLLTEATAIRIKSESAWQAASAGNSAPEGSDIDSSLQEIRVQLKQSESEYAALSQKFRPSYGKMTAIRAKIETLRKSLRKLLEERMSTAISDLKQKYEADKSSETNLQKEFEAQKVTAFELSKKEVQYNVLKREYDSLKELNESVLRQLQEAHLGAELKRGNVSLVERAAVPLSASSPNVRMNMLLALFFGPCTGVALALLLDFFDRTVKDEEEISREFHLPTLGTIPDFLRLYDAGSESQSRESSNRPAGLPALPAGRHPGEHELIVADAPSSSISELFRSIRTALLLSTSEQYPKIVLLTSTKMGEGKTVLTGNLGVAMALTGKKVLLLNADLRRPKLDRYFITEDSQDGLTEYLSGQASLQSIIIETDHANLHFIPSGSIAPNPAELLGSKKMGELLNELRGKYDHILIDTPPIFPVTDAVLLSQFVDGVLLVIRAHSTSRPMVKDALRRLRHVGARVLGVVLNGVDVSRPGYYQRYSYRYDYCEWENEDENNSFKRWFNRKQHGGL